MSLDSNSKRFTKWLEQLDLTWTREEKQDLIAQMELVNKWTQQMLAKAVLLAQKLNDKTLSEEEKIRINDEIAKVLTTPIPWDESWIHQKNHNIIYWQ